MSESAAPSFGATFVGPEFTWNAVGEDGEVTEHKFRARSGLTFEEALEHRSIGAELQMDSQLLLRTLQRRSNALDGDEAEARPIEELRDEIHGLTEETRDHERMRWQRIIDQTLLLVHPPHRDQLRPHLEVSGFDAVMALRDWLTDTVLGRSEKQAEAAGGVDPTLPPPPPDSPSSETGGPDSEPEASSSTD